MVDAADVTIDVPGGPLPGLLMVPPGARWLYVLAHGAGAGMRHAFMEAAAGALAAAGIATLRWEMPFMAAGRRRSDPPAVCEAAARAACAAGRAAAPDLRLCAGGKSMGGRMTSRAQAAAPIPGVEALVFLGFPLHPPKQPGTSRADHLAQVAIPMLFVQGTRDALADLTLLRPVVAARPLATMVEIDTADHGFAVLARRKGDDIPAEIAARVAGWLDALPLPAA